MHYPHTSLYFLLYINAVSKGDGDVARPRPSRDRFTKGDFKTA